MKVMLIMPHQFDPAMANLALSCLASVLCEAGHTVLMRDINIEAYDYFLSRDQLAQAHEKYLESWECFPFPGNDPVETERLLSISSICWMKWKMKRE